jgi:hypothetical protein
MATQQRKTDFQYGLSLDSDELGALEAAKIRAQSRIFTVRQPGGKLVLKCQESGGGAKDIGHYIGFLPLKGFPFVMNQKLISLGKNSLHRRIVATAIVRFEVFRYRDNYLHAWITLHRITGSGNESKQQVVSGQTLFRGKYGEIGKNGKALFPSEDGTADLSIDTYLLPGFEAAVLGSRCRGTSETGCQHAGHFGNIPEIGPEDVLAAHRITAPKTEPVATSEAVAISPVAGPAPAATSKRKKQPAAFGLAAAD